MGGMKLAVSVSPSVKDKVWVLGANAVHICWWTQKSEKQCFAHGSLTPPLHIIPALPPPKKKQIWRFKESSWITWYIVQGVASGETVCGNGTTFVWAEVPFYLWDPHRGIQPTDENGSLDMEMPISFSLRTLCKPCPLLFPEGNCICQIHEMLSGRKMSQQIFKPHRDEYI